MKTKKMTIIIVLVFVLIGCKNINDTQIQVDSDKISINVDNMEHVVFTGDTSVFNIKPELIALNGSSGKLCSFIYFASSYLGSPGIRSEGHFIEYDKKSQKFYDVLISEKFFQTKYIDGIDLNLLFSDTSEPIDLTDLRNKYESSDLKDRESFSRMMEADTYMIQGNIYMDDTLENVYVDYHVINQNYNLFLFTFTIQYNYSDASLNMTLYDVRFTEGTPLDYKMLTSSDSE